LLNYRLRINDQEPTIESEGKIDRACEWCEPDTPR